MSYHCFYYYYYYYCYYYYYHYHYYCYYSVLLFAPVFSLPFFVFPSKIAFSNFSNLSINLPYRRSSSFFARRITSSSSAFLSLSASSTASLPSSFSFSARATKFLCGYLLTYDTTAALSPRGTIAHARCHAWYSHRFV